MGLLRRAGLAALGQQEAAPEGPPARRGGLRNRCLAYLRESPPPAALPAGEPPAAAPVPEPVAAPAHDAADILTALRALPDSVELPSQVFKVLKDLLGIQRGSLLLYDPARMVYAPWASSGFDQTTLHRLRIPLGGLASFTALANGKALVLEGGEALAEYQRLFSSREFASLERVVLAPFIAEGKLVGALLVAEAAPPFDDARRLAGSLDEVADAASPAMRKARGEAMKAQAASPAGPELPLPEQLSRFLGAGRQPDAPVLFFSVQTSAFERQVLDAHPYLDPFRLREDIRYFVGSFVADLGAAFPLPGAGFLLGLRGAEPGSVDLLVHQLGSFLGSLFGSYNGRGPTLPVVRTRALPADGSDAAGLAAFFTA